MIYSDPAAEDWIRLWRRVCTIAALVVGNVSLLVGPLDLGRDGSPFLIRVAREYCGKE